jgi:hypothetical protein
MKRLFIPCTLILLYALPTGAQQDIARRYIAEVNEQAVIFSGKVQKPYPEAITASEASANYNWHPYLVLPDYSAGEIHYNHTLYIGVSLRYDLLRDELLACPAERLSGVVLEKEKVKEARLHGVRIIPHTPEYGQGIPHGNYLILLHDGNFPAIKKYTVVSRKEIRDGKTRMMYSVKPHYYICIEDLCHRVTGKTSVLKLFPQHKAALNAYAKEHKLNFRIQREQSILALITYRETLR